MFSFQKKQLLFQADIKFIYSEKATKFCKIFTLLLTVCTAVKSKVKILQNFVAFSEYMNFAMTFPSFSLAGSKILLTATWYNSKTRLDSRVLF